MYIDRLSIPFPAFLQSTGLTVYTGLVSLLFAYGESWFGTVDNFLSPILFLLAFIISATVSALLVISRSIYPFWEKDTIKH